MAIPHYFLMDIWIENFENVQNQKNPFPKNAAPNKKKSRKQTPPQITKKLTWMTDPSHFNHFQRSYGHFSKFSDYGDKFGWKKHLFNIVFHNPIFFLFLNTEMRFFSCNPAFPRCLRISHLDDFFKYRPKKT